MKITSINKYKGSTYELVLDEDKIYYLNIDTIVDFGLRSGMDIDSSELKKLLAASEFRKAYQYAMYCLDVRDYSAEDMFSKLMKTYDNEELCLAVIKKLAKAGFINDRRYAQKLARKLVCSKKFGYYRAKRELLQKGIDSDTAEEALGPYDQQFLENLSELINNKHYRLLTDPEDRRSVEKVKNALVRYGYSYDDINRAVREYFENDP